MRKILLVIGLMIFLCCHSQSQTPVILDADIDSDVDDVAALAMINKLVLEKKIRLLGVVVTSDDPYAPACADAINRHFKNTNIPIGFKKDQSQLRNHSKYTRQISEEYETLLKSYKNAEDATSLYRKLLAQEKDNSVIIITIGHLTSLQDFLKSSPDSISKLPGKILAQKKVKSWYCMGGMYPSGKEANFYRPDPGSTTYCLANWTKPVIFSGWELGNKIISGGQEFKQNTTKESPVYRGFELYNNFAGRPSWDQTSILLLVTESKNFFDMISDGRCVVNEDGSNQWIKGKKTNHSYLTLKENVDGRTVAKFIDQLITE